MTELLAPREALPLRYHTPDTWAAQALAEPLTLLGDHAHLERKAAANALELINRWPGVTGNSSAFFRYGWRCGQ